MLSEYSTADMIAKYILPQCALPAALRKLTALMRTVSAIIPMKRPHWPYIQLRERVAERGFGIAKAATPLLHHSLESYSCGTVKRVHTPGGESRKQKVV